MDQAARRRVLGVLVALTVALLVADLSGWGVAGAVRRAGGAAFGPMQRVLSGAPRDDLARVEADNVHLREENAALSRALAETAQLRLLLDADVDQRHRLVAARVVAAGLSPVDGRSVTLDVGARDGVAVDATVVAADGLVGRVVAVSPWTCDVQVLGSPGSVVGVRVGDAGRLATVAAPTPSDIAPRPRGSLSLTLVQPGAPSVGDLVTTLGSVDEKPYAAGLVVGTVTSVDPDAGRATRTATVLPAVDRDTLDVVAVIVPSPRAAPGPTTSTGLVAP